MTASSSQGGSSSAQRGGSLRRPNDFTDLTQIQPRLAAFPQRYNATATPSAWKSTADDLLTRIDAHEHEHPAGSLTPKEFQSRPLSCYAVAATPAVRALERAGVPFSLHEYDPAPPADHTGAHGYGEVAVAALGADPAQVFKTLIARVDGALTVAVVPVSGRLDLKALAAAAGGRRAAMADPADAERTTGYVRGGISPLGQRKALPTVVDDSALRFATVLVSAGRRGLQLELAPADLVRLTRACAAPISL